MGHNAKIRNNPVLNGTYGHLILGERAKKPKESDLQVELDEFSLNYYLNKMFFKQFFYSNNY